MFEEDYISGSAPRVNVDDLFEKMNSELQDINVNIRNTFTVKACGKYVARNSSEGINKGKRYVLSDNKFVFYKEAEAYDAARTLGGVVTKE